MKIPDPERRLRQYPHQFSGGMRQRICIAMALLSGPDLLIADEPTTALDATLEVQVIHLLKELQRDVGCSMLFISHHLGVVAELCDRVAIMYAGEVVERGTVRDRSFTTPAIPMRASCSNAIRPASPSRRATCRPFRASCPISSIVPGGCIFQARCPRRLRALRRAADGAPPRARRISPPATTAEQLAPA